MHRIEPARPKSGVSTEDLTTAAPARTSVAGTTTIRGGALIF